MNISMDGTNGEIICLSKENFKFNFEYIEIDKFQLNKFKVIKSNDKAKIEYIINCNEPIYIGLNKLEFDGDHSNLTYIDKGYLYQINISDSIINIDGIEKFCSVEFNGLWLESDSFYSDKVTMITKAEARLKIEILGE